ncbi:ATP phosphoribosyltransferase regulatory subunit [Methyloceanibacter sp.]|uniref:ATP phosphoribosyltransferase regulatory subunit n=1 Tax=Methyloceanibacter sp. TaxID=1965321 RepID=UPI002BE0DE75|nr:ATP phosphoribosyltransferase regulatory subunit [Methyloceanibacter sp.]HML90998.1 ATP phosphoribosyltransferase regulatory subunit [Methyloceanibacter sp.]
MTAETAKAFEALEVQARDLVALFGRAGYEFVAPAILQPAGVFLDQIGEQVRGRSYVFTDLAGEELCLRPDLTVPVSRLYLERHPQARTEARYCYNGPAFRFQPLGPSATHPREFRQAGVECFGAADKAAADTEVLLLAVEAVRSAGLRDHRLRFGDIALFYALVDALELPERWRLKLRHYFWRPPSFHALLDKLAKAERPEPNDVVAKLGETIAGKSQEEAEDIVSAYLHANGIPLAGTRTLREIAARLLDQAADLYADALPKEVETIIEYYLAVEGTPRDAADKIGLIARGAGLDIDGALATVTRRFDLLEEAGVDLSGSILSTEFGRKLEYYSGLVFQIEAPGMDETEPVAGGGRYDNLLTALGAPRPVPAVGSAIHTERLLAAVGGTPS